MKITRLALVVVCFFVAGYGQSVCQQKCDNADNRCYNDAAQQYSTCVANAAAGFSCAASCSAPNGSNCPNYTTQDCQNNVQAQSLSCCQTYNAQVAQCQKTDDDATAVCDANYAYCSNNCTDQVPPGMAKRKLPKRPAPASDAMWALLVRNLSRPEKLNLAL